jgi:hypothetical protein
MVKQTQINIHAETPAPTHGVALYLVVSTGDTHADLARISSVVVEQIHPIYAGQRA